MSDQDTVKQKQRPTEPLPGTYKPALRFVGFLALVVAGIAIASVVVDRMIYG